MAEENQNQVPDASQSTQTNTIKLAPVAPGAKLPGVAPRPIPGPTGSRPIDASGAGARPIPSPSGSRPLGAPLNTASRPIPSPTGSRPLGAPLNTSSRPLNTGTRSFARPTVSPAASTIKLGGEQPPVAPQASQTIRLAPSGTQGASGARPGASNATIRLNTGANPAAKKTISLRKPGEAVTPSASTIKISSSPSTATEENANANVAFASNSILQDPSVRFRTRPQEAPDTGGLTTLIVAMVSILVLGILCYESIGQFYNLYYISTETNKPVELRNYLSPIVNAKYDEVYNERSGSMEVRPEKVQYTE